MSGGEAPDDGILPPIELHRAASAKGGSAAASGGGGCCSGPGIGTVLCTAAAASHSVADGAVHIEGSMTIGGDKYQHDRGKLQAYCDGVVEEHEEPLSEAIRAAGAPL